MSTLTPARIAAEVEYFTEREQAVRDARADAEYERRERAAGRVTFDEVLEQIAAMPEARKARIMKERNRDTDIFEWAIRTMFEDAFEAATDLRVAQGD